jgi:hypothetical protein
MIFDAFEFGGRGYVPKLKPQTNYATTNFPGKKVSGIVITTVMPKVVPNYVFGF